MSKHLNIKQKCSIPISWRKVRDFPYKDLRMVRLTKQEKQDKLELLASINQMNIGSSQNIDNRKYTT